MFRYGPNLGRPNTTYGPTGESGTPGTCVPRDEQSMPPDTSSASNTISSSTVPDEQNHPWLTRARPWFLPSSGRTTRSGVSRELPSAGRITCSVHVLHVLPSAGTRHRPTAHLRKSRSNPLSGDLGAVELGRRPRPGLHYAT